MHFSTMCRISIRYCARFCIIPEEALETTAAAGQDHRTCVCPTSSPTSWRPWPRPPSAAASSARAAPRQQPRSAASGLAASARMERMCGRGVGGIRLPTARCYLHDLPPDLHHTTHPAPPHPAHPAGMHPAKPTPPPTELRASLFAPASSSAFTAPRWLPMPATSSGVRPFCGWTGPGTGTGSGTGTGRVEGAGEQQAARTHGLDGNSHIHTHTHTHTHAHTHTHTRDLAE